MNTRIKLLLSIAMIILGWVLNALAWVTKGPIINSICLLLGVGLMIGGIILLIVTLTSKTK